MAKNKTQSLQIGNKVKFTLDGWYAHLDWYKKSYGRLPDVPGDSTYNTYKNATWEIIGIDFDAFMFAYGQYRVGNIPITLANQWFELVMPNLWLEIPLTEKQYWIVQQAYGHCENYILDKIPVDFTLEDIPCLSMRENSFYLTLADQWKAANLAFNPSKSAYPVFMDYLRELNNRVATNLIHKIEQKISEES